MAKKCYFYTLFRSFLVILKFWFNLVIVSSGLMVHGKIDMDDSRQFIEGRKPKENEKVPKHAPIGYCDSKLMNAVFARELATRYKVIMSTVLEI